MPKLKKPSDPATRADLIKALNSVAKEIKVHLNKHMKEILVFLKPLRSDIHEIREYVQHLEEDAADNRMRITSLEQKIHKLENFRD